MEEEDREWLSNYLNAFNSYIQPRVVFDNLDALKFCTPNSKKTSRVKFDFRIQMTFMKSLWYTINKVFLKAQLDNMFVLVIS